LKFALDQKMKTDTQVAVETLGVSHRQAPRQSASPVHRPRCWTILTFVATGGRTAL
jgi:hypothetical protein